MKAWNKDVRVPGEVFDHAGELLGLDELAEFLAQLRTRASAHADLAEGAIRRTLRSALLDDRLGGGLLIPLLTETYQVDDTSELQPDLRALTTFTRRPAEDEKGEGTEPLPIDRMMIDDDGEMKE